MDSQPDVVTGPAEAKLNGQAEYVHDCVLKHTAARGNFSNLML